MAAARQKELNDSIKVVATIFTAPDRCSNFHRNLTSFMDTLAL
jgi:hypothetical protein